MEQHSSQGPSVSIRIIYQDLPDLIELEAQVRVAEWSGTACAYTSPDILRDQARNLIAWSRRLDAPFTIGAGADTGIGWVNLRFYTTDLAGHVACHAQLATGVRNRDARPAQTWRLSVEFATEPGLIDAFARHLAALLDSAGSVATLRGVPVHH